jgi:hypothetical protein
MSPNLKASEFMATKRHKNQAAGEGLNAPIGAQNQSGCEQNSFCAFSWLKRFGGISRG